MKQNLIGPQGQLFAEPGPGPGETTFRVDNTSAKYYQSQYFRLHQRQVQPIPAPRRGAAPLNLADFAGAAIIKTVTDAGKITFHAVGDTGAAKVNRQQTVQRAIADEATVADAMTRDVSTMGGEAPAFLFHLGDVVYHFGEAQYYYDQFYEPFRGYDRPIFAVPGNHDGMVFGQGSSAPQTPTLEAFLSNFCAPDPGPAPDAGGLVRSLMTQPGVYFALDAPFVSIIGLYSNVLEGPGVISSQKGHFPLVDDQLTFLQQQLQRLQPDRKAGKRAVVLAVHHPPVSAGQHGGSTGLQGDIDAVCQRAGAWPDLVLSGHAHLYERYTYRAGGKEIPYVVAGNGGFALTPPTQAIGRAPLKVDAKTTLEIDPILKFGYLLISTDARTLTASFQTSIANNTTVLDSVTVDLRTGTLLRGRPGATGGGPGGGAAGGRQRHAGASAPGKTRAQQAKQPRARARRRR